MVGLEIPRILLAEDSPAVRATVKKLLERDYFDVVGEACDGREAVRMATSLRPDVIVLDRVMPHMGGFEAAYQIGRSGASPRMILLTIHLAAHHIVRGMQVGIRGFVSKTDAADQLVHAVQEVCLGGTFFSATALRVMRDAHMDTPGNPPATRS